MSENVISLALLEKRYAELTSEDARLKTGGGGGTSDGMDTVDAKIAASEARTDTKFAELRGDINTQFAELRMQLAHMPSKNTLWAAVGTGAAAVLGVLLAIIAFGGDRFDAGMGVADQRQAQLQRDQKQDAALSGIEGKIDQLIEAQKSAR